MAAACTLSVPPACTKPATHAVIIEQDGRPVFTSFRCVDHPPYDIPAMIERTSPDSSVIILALDQPAGR